MDAEFAQQMNGGRVEMIRHLFGIEIGTRHM